MEELFNIENFNIIEDEKNYYFFRALNRADSKDLQDGTILDENGSFIRIRTDSERYEEDQENGAAKYKEDDEISLEQAHDHIKMHYRKDTNCISLSSNANVLLDYGRRNYNDEYVMIKVPKKEMGQRVKFAGQYMLEEIEKKVNEFISSLDENDEKNKKILEDLKKIENATDESEIKEIIKTTFKSTNPINKSKSMLKPGIKYRAPHSRISSYKALSDEQNLLKNKIIAKLTLLERKANMESMIPYVSNNNVVQSIGNAFSSMEQIHYGDIEGEQIQNVPSIVMDMFALIQQIQDKSIENVEEIKRELITFVENGMHFETSEDSIFFRNDKVKDNITIEEMYELTNGKVEFGMANSIVKNMFYLSKSQARAREVAKYLNQITGNNPKYRKIIEYIAKNGFRIEPEAITRQSNKGYGLSESVSLDLKENEMQLVEAIRSLSTEEQIEILEKGGLSNTRNIITETFSRVQRDEKINREEYFAGAIIDLYNWKNIGIEEFTIEQRNDLLKKLQEKDCVEIYRRLKEAEVEEKDIPLYAINIASKEQFSNILTAENYIELIQQNKEALGQELSIPQIEEFLEYNKIDGTNIVLRDHQRLAVESANEKLETKRYATVVSPTGSGKSFIALTELLEHKDERILYLAPNNLILEQIKDYIVDYIHGKEGTLGKTKDEIVAEVFPNIKFETYGGLLAQKGQEIIKDKYDFIVLDELHRTGAKEWEGKLDELLENQEESTKVLGITATPIRDMDNRNMADEIALKLGYTKEEVQRREHIVMDMDLINAIKLGLVVNPKVFSPEYITELDGNLLEKINSIQDENLRKEKLADYERLRRNLDNAKGIPEILKETIEIGEKYIVYIPITDKSEIIEDKDGNIIGQKTGKDQIKEYERKLREYLKDSGIKPKFYSMLGAYSNKKNEEQLSLFEIDDPQNVKFMIVMNKANEGLHIKGLNGVIWFRALDENSTILYLQQLGRAIYSEDPNNPTPNEKRPKVIDLVGNTLNVNIEKQINNNTRRDDYELLYIIVDWVKIHDGIPNIDSTNKIEQRYSATLYRIHNKYIKYIKGFDQFQNLDDSKKEEIRLILEKGAEIDLWDIELPPKTMTEINKMLNVDAFEITGKLKDFVDLKNEIEEIVGRSTTLKNALEIEKWCKDNFGNKKIWERRLPSLGANNEYERKLSEKFHNIRTKIKQYEEMPIEQIQNEEVRQIVDIIRRIYKEYGLGGALKNALEIEEWCMENYGEKKIYERKLPSSRAKDEYENKLGEKLHKIRKKIKQYGEMPIEQIQNEEDRRIVEIVRKLDKEFGLGGYLKNAMKIDAWCKERFGTLEEPKLPRYLWRLPSTKSKDEYEKKIGYMLHTIRAKIKKYTGVELKRIENEKDRRLVERIRKIDNEYGLGNSLKNALEIEAWCNEKFKDKKIWERRLPSEGATDSYEKTLVMKLDTIRVRIKKYKEIMPEKIQNEEDREIVKIIRRLDREYGFGISLKNVLEIEEWCREKYKTKKIWERKLPSTIAKDNYEKGLANKLKNLRTIKRKYEGVEIEQIKNEEDRQIVEIIRRLYKEYGLGGALKNALEIEEWCKETYGEKKTCERKLPNLRAKDEYENKLGKKLHTIRKKIKQYEEMPIEQIQNEEDRQIVEIIRRIDREYNYRKFKGKDIATLAFETGITDVELCDDEGKALQQLVEQTKEGGIKLDEQS